MSAAVAGRALTARSTELSLHGVHGATRGVLPRGWEIPKLAFSWTPYTYSNAFLLAIDPLMSRRGQCVRQRDASPTRSRHGFHITADDAWQSPIHDSDRVRP